MSLYYEAASFIEESLADKASIKSRIFKKNGLKNKPTHIWALISKATIWSSVLGNVIERAEVLNKESKLTPSLALLLTHDLLLSSNGIAAPAKHVLKLTISRHKARLSAEFVRGRIRAGFASSQEWLAHLESDSIAAAGEEPSSIKHPRWIRINSLKTTLDVELTSSFAGYGRAASLAEVIASPALSHILFLDVHIPNLIALPPGSDWSKSQAYLDGRLIFQDKASCFPAYFLDFEPASGVCIDACAAPGNKTSHLAALAQYKQGSLPLKTETNTGSRILACERNPARASVLQKMLQTAGATPWVQCLPGQDFLALDPDDVQWSNVSALLLDPSCSGSGIVGRDNDHSLSRLVLPRKNESRNTFVGASKKRKRPDPLAKDLDSAASPLNGGDPEQGGLEADTDADAEEQRRRLKQLSDFQTTILRHAMRFPGATKICYSTCSIHEEENEFVVLRALQSPVALRYGWKIWTRKDQVEGMKKWPHRGSVDSAQRWNRERSHSSHDPPERVDLGDPLLQQIAEACIRCDKGSATGTIGFFVAGFVRDGEGTEDGDSWDGFSASSET